MKVRIAVLGVAALLGAAGASLANHGWVAGRENNVGTIAGFLTGCFDDYTFQGSAGQTLAADVDHTYLNGEQDFCLEVIGPNGSVVCSNDDDPIQNDPAVGCPIRNSGIHRIRVSLDDESCGNGVYTSCEDASGSPDSGYLLHLSLRNRAREGALTTAVADSRNLMVNP